jgi:hypothetical protein
MQPDESIHFECMPLLRKHRLEIRCRDAFFWSQTLTQPSAPVELISNRAHLMPRLKLTSRCKAILRAWPPVGAFFVFLSFGVTAFWFVHAFLGKPEGDFNWLEPLAVFLAGLGAFLLAAILIFRKVDCARAEADSYGLARGLATGYYFNFIRPLVTVLKDPDHSLHSQVKEMEDHHLVGIVVGLAETKEDFQLEKHDEILANLEKGPGPTYKLVKEVKILIEGRPRPVVTKLALSNSTKAAIVIDIPTTLSVISDFARFLAQQELGDSPAANDAMQEAREEIVTASQTSEFDEVLTEFIDVVNKVGAKESRKLSPAPFLNIVGLDRMRKRMDELAGH